MIFNNETFEIGKVIAVSENFIEISNKVGNRKIIMSILLQKRINELVIGERKLLTSIFEDLATIEVDDGYFKVDIMRDEIYITKLEENIYKIEINISEPVIIYKTTEQELINLKIETTFSFTDDYKYLPNYDILKKGNKTHTHEELNSILEKL